MITDCMTPVMHHDGGSRHALFIVLFILILFAVFFRRGLGGDCGDSVASSCGGAWGGFRPADFNAINTFANAIPQPQAEIMKQQAIDTGILAREINMGNQETRALIASTAHNAEIGALRDQLYKERMDNMEYRVNANTDNRVNALSAQVASGFCETLKRPPVHAAVGVPHLGCTNFGRGLGNFGGNFGLGDCGC